MDDAEGQDFPSIDAAHRFGLQKMRELVTIAAKMTLERRLAMDDKLLRLMSKRCAGALRDQRAKGVARAVDGGGIYKTWELVR